MQPPLELHGCDGVGWWGALERRLGTGHGIGIGLGISLSLADADAPRPVLAAPVFAALAAAPSPRSPRALATLPPRDDDVACRPRQQGARPSRRGEALGLAALSAAAAAFTEAASQPLAARSQRAGQSELPAATVDRLDEQRA